MNNKYIRVINFTFRLIIASSGLPDNVESHLFQSDSSKKEKTNFYIRKYQSWAILDVVKFLIFFIRLSVGFRRTESDIFLITSDTVHSELTDQYSNSGWGDLYGDSKIIKHLLRLIQINTILILSPPLASVRGRPFSALVGFADFTELTIWFDESLRGSLSVSQVKQK